MAERARPVFVWLIVAFNLFGLVVSGFGIGALLTRRVAMSDGARAYYGSLSILDWSAAALGFALSLAATVALFRLSKIAAPLLTASAIFGALRTAKYVALNGYAAAMGSLLIPAIGIALAIAICVYAWRLKARGILA